MVLEKHFGEVSVAPVLVLYSSLGQKGLALFSSRPQIYFMEEKKNQIRCENVFTRPCGKRGLHKELPHSSSLSLPSSHAPAGTSRHSQLAQGKLFHYSYKLLKPFCDAKRTFPGSHILPTNNFHMQK